MSLAEQLTKRFYEWERRGRGHLLFGVPVELEPAFSPFTRQLHATASKDDVREHTPFTFMRDLLTGFGGKKSVELPKDETPLVRPYRRREGLCALVAILPKKRAYAVSDSEQLLVMLSQSRHPVSFELLATRDTIRIQWVTRHGDSRLAEAHLRAFFPEVEFLRRERPEPLLLPGLATCAADLGLEQEFMLPIRMPRDSERDPLAGLIGILDGLYGEERAAVQVLFQGTGAPWAQAMHYAVTDFDGSSFFLDASQMPKMAAQKASSPLFGTCVRVMAQSANEGQAYGIAEALTNSLCNATESADNSLIPLSGEKYQDNEHFMDIEARESRRSGMLLNSAELSSFLHLPTGDIVSMKFEGAAGKTKEAPYIGEGMLLGFNTHNGIRRAVFVPDAHRLRHTHLIGATGTGKSTLLLHMIMEDVMRGNGLAVLDPHGDLIESVLRRLPEARHRDVVLVDPSDTEYPVGFNILSASSDIEKDMLSSDLVAVFRRLSTSWGDQMNSVLANAILAFLESSRGGTLLDLRRFLLEKDFREGVLATVGDPHISYYWRKEYPLLRSSSIGSILTRLDGFLRPRAIRNMVMQKKGLDFADIMDSGKILLVKLPQGLIGEENAYLLGTLFVTKLYQAAMARQAQQADSRKAFFTYVDEFQNFVTPSMSSILSGARKYRLGLVLAHQDMQQLAKHDPELAGAVTSNCGTRVCFRLGDSDAKRFEDNFSHFDAEDLQSLPTGSAVARFDRRDSDFNLEAEMPEEADLAQAERNRQVIVAMSRERYGVPASNLDSNEYYANEPEPKQKEAPKRDSRQKKEDARQEQEAKENAYTEPDEKVVEEPIQEKKETESQNVEQPAPRQKMPSEEVRSSSEADKKQVVEDLVRRKAISHHRYLQTLIKRMAEARGFVALIEQPTPDGKGRVDVSLEKDGLKIACEVGITTTKDWELHNIEKCLAAGYSVVIACSSEKVALDLMRRKVNEYFKGCEIKQILVLSPEDLFAYLENIVKKSEPEEKIIKGYRVKVIESDTSKDSSETAKKSIKRIFKNSKK